MVARDAPILTLIPAQAGIHAYRDAGGRAALRMSGRGGNVLHKPLDSGLLWNDGRIPALSMLLNLSADAFEFIDERGDLLKNVLLPG